MKRATGGSHQTRRANLYVPEIVLDRESPLSLHRQIGAQLAGAIRSGAIPNGARLPSTRVLARMLSVSRNTALAAYDELAADGLVRGERGVGMRVHYGSAAPELNLFALRQVIRDAGYPARIMALEDLEGNPLYIRH